LREILISLGVIIVCTVVLVVAQITTSIEQVQAANQNTPISVQQTVATSSSPLFAPDVVANAQTLIAQNMTNSEEKVITTDSGLQYVDLEVGDGSSPTKGQTVTVHYTGTLTDGKKFDSSRDREQPFQFKIGVSQVIKGWDEGIALLNKGAKVKLIIPYWLAYGEAGRAPVIPAKATLIFDTEMVNIK